MSMPPLSKGAGRVPESVFSAVLAAGAASLLVWGPVAGLGPVHSLWNQSVVAILLVITFATVVLGSVWLGYGGHPSIVWEGGPHEWACLFPLGGIEEEFGFTVKPVELPEGIWTEAMTSFAISIYREEV
jgi:hypothetical protein